ncbi:MAG: hypothetical protein ABI443_09900 [Chthoniobacterales bacterium]
MKVKDIKDVLTFAAFRPEPDDSSATWLRRFPNKKTLVLNIGKNNTSWHALGKGGVILDGGVHQGDFKDIASTFASEWRKYTENGWCNISINNRYVISLENNLPRKEGVENIMRVNPRSVLGSKYERTKRYALTSNPEHETSIVLSCDDESIKKVESILSETSLHAGRICCGTYTMLRRLIEHANAGGKPGAVSQNYLFVVCCEGSVCVLTQVGDKWSDLRSRTDFYEEDTSPVLDMVAPLIRENEQQSMEILFVSDKEGSDLPLKLTTRLENVKVTDLTQPNHLVGLLADLR